MSQHHATYQFRGYVSHNQRSRLEDTLAQCAVLYNAALQERRDAWRMKGKGISYIDQCKSLVLIRADWADWEALDTNIGRGVLRRVDRAYAGFCRRVQAGQTPGFPRFKPRSRYTCIELAETRPGMVKHSPCGRLAYVRIKGLPIIKLQLKGRMLPDSKKLKSLRIVQRPSGIVVDVVYEVEREPQPANGRAVGIDLGVNNRLALSDGTMVGSRRVDRRRERRLQRAVARCHRGSHSHRKRVRMLARERHRNALQNRNAVHQLTTGLINDYGYLAMEKLIIPNMTRTARGTAENPGVNVGAKQVLNREIQAQTWGMIRQQLRYKAEWAGRELVEVDPKYTSRICNECGNITPQSEYRTYRCSVCGLEADRDTNAALNILERAFGNAGGILPQNRQAYGLGSER